MPSATLKQGALEGLPGPMHLRTDHEHAIAAQVTKWQETHIARLPRSLTEADTLPICIGLFEEMRPRVDLICIRSET